MFGSRKLDTNNTLYYTKLPEDTDQYLARGIVPVLQGRIDKRSFKSLDEAVYLKGRYSDLPVLCAFAINVKTVTDNLGIKSEVLNRSDESSLGEYATELANFLSKYVQKNQGRLKVVALYDELEGLNEEEEILRAAVELMTESSICPVKLEEIIE